MANTGRIGATFVQTGLTTSSNLGMVAGILVQAGLSSFSSYGMLGGTLVQVALVGPFSAPPVSTEGAQMATHNPNIDINIYLDANAASVVGFGNVCLVVPLSENPLDSTRVIDVSSLAEADSLLAAADISSTTYDQLVVAFSQVNRPDVVKVAYWDTTTPETAAAAIAAIRAEDDDFYAFVLQSRADASISAWSDAVEALDAPRKLVFFQSDDVNLYGTISSWSIYSAISTNERTIVHYNADAEYQDLAHAVQYLGFDPDEKSAPFDGPVSAVTVPSLTQSQRNQAVNTNYVNIAAVYGPSDSFVDPGKTLTGRPIYELVSADWFEARLQEGVAELKVSLSSRGQKLPINAAGQALVSSVIRGVYSRGVLAGHFEADQLVLVAEPIVQSDYDAQQMRFTVSIQLATSARLFTFNVYLQRDPVVSE